VKVFAWLGAAFIAWMVLFALALGAALDGTIQASRTGAALLSSFAGIPPDYLIIYQQAGERYHLDWAMLAAIGRVETDHGQSGAVGVRPPSTNFHGCCAGPMQFCVIDGCPAQGPTSLTVDEAQAGTWKGYGVDGNHDGVKDPWDPARRDPRRRQVPEGQRRAGGLPPRHPLLQPLRGLLRQRDDAGDGIPYRRHIIPEPAGRDIIAEAEPHDRPQPALHVGRRASDLQRRRPVGLLGRRLSPVCTISACSTVRRSRPAS
jgi:hypothetical protein